jgi:CheY-like chemotaxis protein
VDAGPDGTTPVAVVVQDSGIGISEDRLGAIFEAFQQAEAGTARKYGGTGLGLTISRSICLLMGYDLVVDSVMGKGSTFTIVMGERPRRHGSGQPSTVPVAERSPERADPTAAKSAGSAARPATGPPGLSLAQRLGDLRVLVIDDENDSRDLMTHYLEDFGCHVETASGGEEGIRVAQLTRPDLITLDLMMPEMSGREVLRRLKSDPDTRHIPVLVVSIVAGEGFGGLFGAVESLTKPVEREDLLGALRRQLSRKRGGRVLVVDDEPRIRRLIADYLGKVGLDVVLAEDGEQGLDAVWREQPDVVLLDTVMPVLDGRGFLSRLRADPAYARLPVLVLAEDHLDDREREELADMASGIIPKGRGMGRELNQALGSIFVLRRGSARGA